MTEKVQEKVQVKAQMGITGFTPKEAALRLTGQGFGITAKQIRRALRKGNLPATQISGRWYIPAKALTKFAKEKEAKTTKETAIPIPTPTA